MAPVSLLIASLNFTQAETLKAGFIQFVVDRPLVLSLSELFTKVLPEFFTKVLPGFFTKVLPGVFTEVLPGFFTKVLPGFFTKVLPGFFTKVLPEWPAKVLEWLARPEILLIITVWWVTFTVVLIIVFCIGFKPVGVAAGSAAAYFQSWMYGGFTPAGGIFATLTSMAMLGTLMPLEVIFSSTVATIAAVIVWKNGYR